ncbi:FG-GAP repeat domain-containing protein [Phaeovulum sp.]|uniref:FG-GAP repeat domain-containing protein n=1 Tax=Phaeovulum sp. TaxID=2934796 RepID=UPI00356A4381
MQRFALALAMFATPALGETIVSARYDAPTARYGHGALAGGEWAELVLVLEGGGERRFGLPADMVFEDVAPRLADLTGDGVAEAVVVESEVAKGARLAIWGPEGRIAAGPFIGTSHRWLAPLGALDVDGDGRLEFAYVLRPHLDAVLSVVRFDRQGLVVLAESGGLPSHQYRSAVLEGGIAACPDGPVMLTADSTWAQVMATRWVDGALQSAALGRYRGPESFAEAAAAMGCTFSVP